MEQITQSNSAVAEQVGNASHAVVSAIEDVLRQLQRFEIGEVRRPAQIQALARMIGRRTSHIGLAALALALAFPATPAFAEEEGPITFGAEITVDLAGTVSGASDERPRVLTQRQSRRRSRPCAACRMAGRDDACRRTRQSRAAVPTMRRAPCKGSTTSRCQMRDCACSRPGWNRILAGAQRCGSASTT